MSALSKEPTKDQILDGRLTIRQPASGYRVAIDPILLAAACRAKSGENVLDLGCGVGTAALAVAWRIPGVICHGIDKQAELIRMAHENAGENNLSERVTFEIANVLDFASAEVFFDHAIANPPYMRKESATASSNPIKAAANIESDAGLKDWVEAAWRNLKPGGSVALIHRADRLVEVLSTVSCRFGEIAVTPVQPRAEQAAHRVIVTARKNVATPLVLLPPFVLHKADGSFTAEAERLLRAGEGLG